MVYQFCFKKSKSGVSKGICHLNNLALVLVISWGRRIKVKALGPTNMESQERNSPCVHLGPQGLPLSIKIKHNEIYPQQRR